MISVVSARYEDLPNLADITQQAYGSDSINQAGLERNFKLQPDGFFMAKVHHKPVGMVSIFDYGTFASIGGLGVLPEYQKQGIGKQLMEHVEGWAGNRKIPSLILDATPEGANLYTHLGYQDLGVNHKMILQTSKHMFATPANVRLIQPEDTPKLLELDRSVFGGNRQKLISVFLEYPERFFVSQNSEGDIDGFTIAQPSTIGPWIAQTHEAAEALLQTAIGLAYEKPPRVLLPGENKSGLELLQKYGFCVEKTLRHMIKGIIPQRQRQRIHGQSSYSLG